MKKLPVLWMCFVFCLVLSQSFVSAQQPVIITITVMEYMADLYEDTVIPLFEAEYPDIQVEIVSTDSGYFGNPLNELEGEENTYYQDLLDYASSADVLYVSDYTLSPYATSTGYFLDLAPLVNADDTLMPEDFYPAAWDAFQTDGGFWALPYMLEVQLLVYNKTMFDDVNFAYPNETWRIEDYIQAAEAMQTYNASGEVELSPLVALNPMLLFLDQIGKTYDETTLPAQPDFTSPELIHILEAYAEYDQTYDVSQSYGYAFDQIPMSVNFPYQLFTNFSSSGEQPEWEVSLLPGGRAGSRVEGFAISSGTAYPEAAYKLVSFLTRTVDVFAYTYSPSPARRSLEGVEPEETSFFSATELEPEVQAILDEAREVALSPNQMRYQEVFYRARSLMNSDNIDAVTALETIEIDMLEALEESQSHQSDQVMVALPELRPELSADEIILHFGMNAQQSNDEREQIWEDVIDEFVASHPRVGVIDLDSQIYGPDGMEEEIDCWYNGYGGSLSSLTEPPEEFLALDPFLSADPNFNPNNFLPGVLEGVKVQSLVYGYPLTVQPMMMAVNVGRFEEVGMPIPQGSWTVNEFTNAMVALGELRTDPEVPIVRTDLYSPGWILMLFGSYGGRPIDFSTDPVTYNLTTPENISAMQQVINYINEGLIQYDGLRERDNFFFGSSPENDYIIINILSDLNMQMQFNDFAGDVELQLVTFPNGTYMPVAYSIGMAHIKSDSPYIQECYDWIQTIASHPEMFDGMPAQQSHFSDPALIAQEGENVISFYEQLTTSLTAPNIMALPDVYGSVPGSSQGAWLEPTFFYQGLDNVVLHGGDLETEMAQAEMNIETFRQCTAGIEQVSDTELSNLFQEDESAARAYFRQFVDCAVTIIPDLRETYSYYYQE